MAPFHTLSFVFAAAGAFATVAIEPQVCSGQIHCDQDEDLTSELQSVSLLQGGTVFVKAKQSASLRTMAELTPSGEAVAVSEDEPSAEDETVSLAVPVDGVQQHVVAEEHSFAAEATEASAKHAEPGTSKDVVPDVPDAQVRKVPMVESIAAAHARRQTRRALPGVSLLGRMSAVVARHGVHAAHTAGALPHVPHPHDEHADTLLVAVCVLLFGAFLAWCLVLEHRSKDRAQAHAKRCLTRATGDSAMSDVLKALPTSIQQTVGAAVAAPHPPSRGASFSVGLEVFAGRTDAFEVSDHTGLPFCTVTLSNTPAGARCLAVTCNEDEGRNCCVIAPPDVADGLQVFGFKGKLHGVAQQDSSNRLSLLRDGQPSAVVEGLKEEPLQQTVFAPSGEVLAASRRDPEAWSVRVEQGSDEVLSIVLLLARVLLAQDSVNADPLLSA